MPHPALTPILDRLDSTRADSLARLVEFLSIPSISAQPAHAGDCRLAAAWAAEHLRGSGFTASIEETGGHPVVLADHPGTGSGPHLLYYGHYDVQPAEPLELWHSSPFAPVIAVGRNGPKIVARGAVDDKGQVSMWLEAFRAWHDIAGGVPCRITVLIEGEEEVGTDNLNRFLHANKERLHADAVVISDTNMWDAQTPAITTRLRGMVYTQINLQAASRDLHSGLYGGSALNPINALTKLLGGLHDENGRVQIPGFYDGVAPVPDDIKKSWEALGFDESAFLADIGLTAPAGETGLSGLTRLWARPTADINGIWGGYQGDGPKTVIAAEAGAKVSFRLVPGQEPAKIFAAFEAWLHARAPKDAKITLQDFGSAPAFVVDGGLDLLAAAQTALSEEYGKPAALLGGGGSIPVVQDFKSILGLDSLLMGFGLDDDQIHSPNEKFDLRCLDHGTRAHARLLAILSA